MLRSSFPVGKLLGVDLRIHWTFPVLLALAIGYSIAATGHASRGFGLWIALCFAVAVREFARSLAGAYRGLRLRALFLLPVGGVMAFTPRSGTPSRTRLVTAAGPAANFGIGLLMMGSCYAFEPHANLLALPWISVNHILRSFVWMQLILGIVSLLPVAIPQSAIAKAKPDAAAGAEPPAAAKTSGMPALNMGTMLALAVVFVGIVLLNQWLILIGLFLLLGSYFGTTQATMSSPEAESIRVREVMLTEYTLLSTSDTLGGALERTVHSLQDVFPVVRGDRLVGSISRATIADALQSSGDSYLQGVMTRNVQTATADEKLVEALRRTASMGASEFIPVVEDGAMLGILTPQSLGRAVHLVKSRRPETPERARE